ncbi:peptidase U32 family protein [Oryzomicrobium terrae]|nr:U32 family peptidase [Oryzomicrobium terrae]
MSAPFSAPAAAPRRHLELLAPAKNADFGIEAINHGADAVYIGGPAFGARSNAGNSVADIARLAAHAHRYNARVLVALNTILRDDELEPARRLAWQMYEAGADALILQDMGLLELDLPPIQLHASTQTDIRSVDKARFLQDVGFSQIVLARELTLKQIEKITAGTDVALEFFVHGALCVAYSGQCYISHAHTGRSANRGDCSQACRLPYDLEGADGQLIAQDKHLLSMKDNDQSANLRALADAGISSFKIEGRLKDLSYVKNITAHYRTLLDGIMEEAPQYRRSSAGRCTFFFTPQPDKTFNRGSTDYFVNDRQHGIGAFDTPKFSGTRIGTVGEVGLGWFVAEVDAGIEPLHNGDGLSFFDSEQELVGVRINRAEPLASGQSSSRLYRLFVSEVPEALQTGQVLYRNRDQAFERALEKKSAERRVAVRMHFTETADGFALVLADEDGVTTTARVVHAHEPAQNGERALASIREHLGKLGTTLYAAAEADIALDLAQPWFIPAGVLNGLRRDAVAALDAARAAAYRRPPRAAAVEPPVPYPDDELTYLGNVYNDQARAFYAKHGVRLIESAYEANEETGAVSLMITKHCLRHDFNLCPKEVKGIKADPLTLINNNERLTLRFDCVKCEMHVVGKLRKNRVISLVAR